MRREFEAARQRFAVLSEYSRTPAASRQLLADAFRELTKIWDELRTAQEELEQQNEQVAGAYEALESERQRYRDLFDLAPDPYLVTSWRGTILEANRAAAGLLNVRQEFLIGKPLGVLIAKDSRREFLSKLVGLREKGHLKNWEVFLQPNKRQPIPVSITVAVSSSLTKSATERKLEMLWLLRDLTQQREAETILRESEERYRSLFENALEGICRATPDGRFIAANPALAKMLGYESPKELLPLQIDKDLYMDPAERGRVLNEVCASSESAIRGREILLKKRDGQPLRASVSVRGIEDGRGRIVAYESLVQDVTDRRQLEDQLRQREHMAAVGATVAVLAHEISNPLTGMYSSIQLMDQYLSKSNSRDATLAECVSNLETETRRLTNLLNDFRLFAQQQYKFEPIRLSDIIQDVLQGQSHAYAQLGIRVEVELSKSLPAISADKNKLKQALLNLCKNATEAMPTGGTLSIRGIGLANGVNLEIKDTGSGVRAGNNIFEPFVSTKEHGTGLGLSIVRQIALGHGGSVTYTSEPEKGTSFRLFLPMHPPHRQKSNGEGTRARK